MRKWLLSGENTNSLRRAVKSETEGSEPGGALAAEAERQCRISETLNEPIYRKAHSYEELSRLDVESLTGGSENAGRTLDRYYEAVGMLRKLWSDNRENDTEVEYCIDQLKAVPSNLTYAGIPVEKIIMLLHYSVSSNDRKRDPDRFREKIGYYKQIVNLSFGVADNKSKIEALDDRIRRAGKKMLELSKEIKTLDDGTAAVQELLLPKKHQYLDLKNSQKRNGKYRTMLDLLVNKYEMEIDRLELVISAVGGDKIDYNASAEAQKAFQEMVMSVETTLKKFDKLDQEMEAAQDLLNETVEGQMDPVQELLDWSKTDQMEQSAEAELDELIRQLN